MKARRDALGYSQKELADLYGCAEASISQYETGKRGIKATDLPRLAEVLHVGVGYFYGEDDGDSEANRPQIIAFYDELPPDSQDDLTAIAKLFWQRSRDTVRTPEDVQQ